MADHLHTFVRKHVSPKLCEVREQVGKVRNGGIQDCYLGFSVLAAFIKMPGNAWVLLWVVEK